MDQEKEIYKGSPSQVINLGIFLACILIIPIPIAIWRWIQVKYTILTITNQRVIMSAGVFSRRTEEIELYRIRDVSVEEPFIFRMFGVGNIIIHSTDKTSPSAVFMAFKNPNWIKDQVRENAEYYRQNRRWGTIN
ncbi:MAG: hypothetical protein A3F91_03680 [Flavobacteria bacterium RIFCSPLOWO2_12_FULL_35_11]|nr:MAG: hypothetical protein A3F91_03680 [Flavobacteria bacterium RIFCSPLOWO2_12_FULL_35_11]